MNIKTEKEALNLQNAQLKSVRVECTPGGGRRLERKPRRSSPQQCVTENTGKKTSVVDCRQVDAEMAEKGGQDD